MVCFRCKMVVKSELQKQGLHYVAVEFGEVEVMEDLTPDQLETLAVGLKKTGLMLLDDERSSLIKKIKLLIAEQVLHNNKQINANLSHFISDKLHLDYTYLSGLFLEVKGTTINNYYLFHKMERVKELMVYDELSLSEIAFKMNYKSVVHLSSEFKKITGLTLSHFRNLKHKRRLIIGYA